jgi:lipopolysaccharide export LptBFGC system permease protein LptF
MNLLDRYIARQYLVNIVILFVVLLGLVITIDTAYNLDKYARAAAEAAKLSASLDNPLGRAWLTLVAIVNFWWPFVLYLFSSLLGLILVGAMGFTLTQMVRHRELVAVVASGQSLHRIARPILIVALALSALSLANQELVIPRIAPLLARDKDRVSTTLTAQSLPLTADSEGRVFYARVYNPQRETLDGVYIAERDIDTGLATREIVASRAAWRDGGWDLESPQLLTGKGAAPARVETSLGPLSIKVLLYRAYSNTLSTGQALWVYRQVASTGARTEQASAVMDQMIRVGVGRISALLTSLVALIISMCFFLTREPVNMFVRALKAAPIGFGGLVGGALTKATLVPGLPAVASVFIPVIVLTPVAVAMWYRVRT